MKKKGIPRIVVTAFFIFLGYCLAANGEISRETIKLPEPRYDGGASVERALAERRSTRHYSEEAVTLAEISQILWAAQGVTDPRGLRTAPSAGALYPLEIYTVAGNVKGLAPGIYKYTPHGHSLERTGAGDKRSELSRAALGQRPISSAPAVLVICGVFSRTMAKYGQRGATYVHMEAGHAAQNVFLQAVSLNLGMVVIGAFSNAAVKTIVSVDENEEPLYIIPIGRLPAGK